MPGIFSKLDEIDKEAEQARASRADRPTKKDSVRKDSNAGIVVSSNHETMQPRHHDTVIPPEAESVVEVVRAAVKPLGEKAATHRFTLDEKKAVADVIYTYLNQGVRTSENEIARIGVNFLLEDYRRNGKVSILNQVLEKLNA